MSAGANAAQYEAWNGESGARWVANADNRDTVLASIADLLLGAAAIRPGERVVDIGCGCGATTLAAAHLAGPTGSALGIDLSQPMLHVAEQRATATRTPNVSFRQADAQTCSLDGHDVAISRFGTMFFADPTAAFANIARGLEPGGRLCMVTWQPLASNEWLVVPGAALLAFTTMPEPEPAGSPGMFAQSDPMTIRSTLVAAGFTEIAVASHTVPLQLGATVDDALDYLASTGPGRAMLETIPHPRRDEALAAVRASLRAHHRPAAGVSLDAAVLLTTAIG